MNTIEFFPYPMLMSLFTLWLLLTIIWKRKRRPAYLICFSLFFCYLVAALGFVFFPIGLPRDWPGNISLQSTLWTLSHVNLFPFNFGYLFSNNATTIFEQLAGNILLTMPFGFGLPFLVSISVRRMLWLALFSGVALEATQLVFELIGILSNYGHSIDINDALLNTAGVMVGYGLFCIFVWLYLGLILHFHISPKGFFEYAREMATSAKNEKN